MDEKIKVHGKIPAYRSSSCLNIYLESLDIVTQTHAVVLIFQVASFSVFPSNKEVYIVSLNDWLVYNLVYPSRQLFI